MESRLVNMASGNTIKTIKNPIAWLFNHNRAVSHFEVKALQDGGGYLVAYLDNNTMLKMFWASYRIMMDRWRNHFSGTLIYKADPNGNLTTTYTI